MTIIEVDVNKVKVNKTRRNSQRTSKETNERADTKDLTI